MSLTGEIYNPPLYQQAVGYIEVDASFASDPMVLDAERGTGYVFGAILYDHRGLGSGIAVSRDIGGLDEAASGIPAVRMAAADIHHAPDPVGATATSWASRRGEDDVRHIVTAKHAVVGLARGQAVAFAGGGFGTLVDFCDGSVDAALVTPPASPPPVVQLVINPDPPIGLDMNFTGAMSRKKSGTITKTWLFPNDPDPYDAQRVHFDVTGAPGDSGALVRLTATGEAIGIYTGIKTGRSSQSGMSQGIRQAAELLDIEMYEEKTP
jgi:hypothetical protein